MQQTVSAPNGEFIIRKVLQVGLADHPKYGRQKACLVDYAPCLHLMQDVNVDSEEVRKVTKNFNKPGTLPKYKWADQASEWELKADAYRKKYGVNPKRKCRFCEKWLANRDSAI